MSVITSLASCMSISQGLAAESFGDWKTSRYYDTADGSLTHYVATTSIRTYNTWLPDAGVLLAYGCAQDSLAIGAKDLKVEWQQDTERFVPIYTVYTRVDDHEEYEMLATEMNLPTKAESLRIEWVDNKSYNLGDLIKDIRRGWRLRVKVAPERSEQKAMPLIAEFSLDGSDAAFE